MFRVVWLQSALDELTALWIGADSATRKAITAASHDVEQQLQSNPHEQGESRGGEERIFFAHPLGVQFDVEQGQGRVRVLHIWDIRRRR